MAKKDPTLLNMVVTLFLVTLAASTALGYIYELTKEPILEARQFKKSVAIQKVIPAFNNVPGEETIKLAMEGDTLFFYKARKDGHLVGVAVESFTNSGFGGNIKIMVGFSLDGTINDISVLEHQETPGLGDKMEKDKSYNKKTGYSWSSQFQGKNPGNFILAVTKDGGDVDAITAATITSRAFCDAVQRAYDGFMEMKPIIIEEESAN